MTEILHIEGMSCNHCVEKIKKFVGEIEGIDKINISLENKTLEVSFNPPCTLEKIKEAVLDSGFEIQ